MRGENIMLNIYEDIYCIWHVYLSLCLDTYNSEYDDFPRIISHIFDYIQWVV